MGTKRQIADTVAEVISRSRPGPLLDVFSGICAVTTAVAPARQVWTNDLQHFACLVSEAFFRSQTSPPSRFDAQAIVGSAYSAHFLAHSRIAADRLTAETAALHARDHNKLIDLEGEWQSNQKLENWNEADGHDAHLFRDLYAGSYFGLSQSIEIDALHYAINLAFLQGRINVDEKRWLTLALCVALSQCSNSTGHFAQPLTPSARNISRFAKQRAKSVRDSWIAAVELMRPIGSPRWRQSNQTFRSDANDLLTSLRASDLKPAVIYADPPYTNDQYSRYYHLYETLILYDYPEISGRGRYRPDRAVSSFSLATAIESTVDKLIKSTAAVGADIVISYPTNGLMKNSFETLPSMLRASYGRSPEVIALSHLHSTMGGSKGASTQEVTEVIYRAFH
jgi:adenine-specific DNA-methyltransferase